MRRKQILKWIIASFGFVILGYLVLVGAFLVGHRYASERMEWILDRNVTMSMVESNKGLLSSREMDRSFINPYLVAGLLPQLDGISNETIVVYSLFNAYFTVVYDNSGKLLVVVDNGL